MNLNPVHVAVTGHTGFKGSWLILLLKTLGYKVSGISLPPKTDTLFTLANLGQYLDHNINMNILNRAQLQIELENIAPDVVIHFAAQSLVREGYREPVNTFDVNITGTLNVLLGIPKCVRSTLIITTDKVYKPNQLPAPYVENDALGGLDPYSASKSAADLLTQSWMANNKDMAIGIARAGNVIGGGDWAKDRLLPDLLRNFEEKQKVILRNPRAIRPWQHVLDCLNGYLMMIDHIQKKESQLILNFGPNHEEKASVMDVFNIAAEYWGADKAVDIIEDSMMKESDYLLLNSSKAMETLTWENKLKLSDSVQWTVDWQKQFLNGGDARTITENQISRFLEIS